MKWTYSFLAEIAKSDGGLIQTGPFGSQLHERDYVSQGIPVVMPKDIVEGRIDSADIAMVSEETARRLSRHMLSEGTIVLPRRGEISKRAFVSAEQSGWLCGTGCLKIELKGNLVFPQFLHYYMGQEKVTSWLEQHAVGSTMLNLSAGIVSELPVSYPSLDVQRKTVDILSAYDDLIANNRRRMALLEESARLLYQEWFVRLRFPGHEHTRIVGGVPDGWSMVVLPEAIHINPRTVLSDDEHHWWVEMADLPTNSMVIHNAVKREGRSGSKFRNGDTLLARITPCLENGKTGFVDFMSVGECGRGSTEFIVLRSRKLTPEYVYCLSRTYSFREHAIKSMIGASGRQRVQERCFDEHHILVPPPPILRLFEELAVPVFRQVKALHSQNQKLRQARDLLLPRLMSGEVELMMIFSERGATE